MFFFFYPLKDLEKSFATELKLFSHTVILYVYINNEQHIVGNKMMLVRVDSLVITTTFNYQSF